MLRRIGLRRHLIVLACVLFVPALVLLGWIGGGYHSERFDQKQVVVSPAVGDGLRIREVADQDFGSYERHGYQRIIPNDFGDPTDVEAFTFDAPTSLWISDMFTETQIRIGDPDKTITGQHRYELDYTLPEAQISSGRLALDIIGTEEEFETGRFEVVVTGFELEDPTCNVGSLGDEGGCTLARDGDVYRVVFEPLEPGQGITIGGRITAVTEPVELDLPPVPDYRSSKKVLGAVALLALGLLAAGVVWIVQSRLGRNQVGGDGAADAAHSDSADGATRSVSDRELQKMATIEFEPPRDVAPWQGAVLLDEAVTTRSVSAWFAEQIARDVLELNDDGNPRLRKGDKWKEADITTMENVRNIFDGKDELVLNRYHSSLGTVWSRLENAQRSYVRKSGLWKDQKDVLGGPSNLAVAGWYALGIPIALVVVIVLSIADLMAAWTLCALSTVALVASVAGIAYKPLRARRSVKGSALALQTESFRRFLASSEGQHVDWAWERGVVREYTAWAYALGAAAAWGRAIENSAFASELAQTLVPPSIFERQLSALNVGRTAPPPPSSGGSSGSSSSSSWSSSSSFSGGSVGGGGGGGSSGSW